MREETRTKWRQEYNAGNGTRSGLEDQLQRLIKAVTNSSTTVTKLICKSNKQGFAQVKDKLTSIYDVVSRKTPEKVVMQEVSSIGTEP